MKLNKVKIANLLGDALSDHLSDTGAYGDLIDGLKVGPKAKEYLHDNVRWTLIDDETGLNLLECDADKRKREAAERALNSHEALLDFAKLVSRSACLNQVLNDECICFSCRASEVISQAEAK